MFFFLKLAFGNIIKNRRSAATIVTAVFISVFFIILMLGYMDGFRMKIINEAVKYGGNIQIYNKKYYDALDFAPVEFNLAWDENIRKKIEASGTVQSIRPEISFGAIANGINDSSETQVLAIDYSTPGGIYDNRKRTMEQGRFINSDKEAVIGVKMAKNLGLKTGDKLVLMTMDPYGSINAVEADISGIFRNYNPGEEEGLVVCSLNLARKLLGLGNVVTSVTVNITEPFAAEKAAETLKNVLPADYIVLPWQKSQPMLEFTLKFMGVATILLSGIIIFVAALGIINSFLMNIIGRFPEFGILRAMGVSKLQLYMMIITESLLLGIIGTAAGLLPGCLLVYYFQLHPFNYEALGKMMNTFRGMDAMIGTALTPEGVAVTAVTGILISLLASLYPALIAVNKKPAEILRVLE